MLDLSYLRVMAARSVVRIMTNPLGRRSSLSRERAPVTLVRQFSETSKHDSTLELSCKVSADRDAAGLLGSVRVVAVLGRVAVAC